MKLLKKFNPSLYPDKDLRGLSLEYLYVDRDVDLSKYLTEGSVFYNCVFKQSPKSNILKFGSTNLNTYLDWIKSKAFSDKYFDSFADRSHEGHSISNIWAPGAYFKYFLFGRNWDMPFFENAYLPRANFLSADWKPSTFSDDSILHKAVIGVNIYDSDQVRSVEHLYNLHDAYIFMPYANLEGADLEDQDLSDSYALTQINFENANLKNTNFSGSVIKQSNFKGADITGADFTGAVYDNHTRLPETLTKEQLSKMKFDSGDEDYPIISNLLDRDKGYDVDSISDLQRKGILYEFGLPWKHYFSG